MSGKYKIDVTPDITGTRMDKNGHESPTTIYVGLTFWDSKNFAPKVECKDQILRTFEQILVLKFKTKCITRVNPKAIPPC